MRRYHSPWETSNPFSAQRLMKDCAGWKPPEPCAIEMRKTATLTPMRVFVTRAPVPAPTRPIRRVAALAPVGWPAHSGHLIPTGA
jgi:hypothetical protein